MKSLALASLVAVVALGCSKPAPSSEPAKTAPKAENPLGPMHEVLAPLWHMPEGPERIAGTCTNVDALAARAADLVAGATPVEAKAREAAWQDGAKALVAQVEALRASCAVAGRADVATRLKDLHTGYHGLVMVQKGE